MAYKECRIIEKRGGGRAKDYRFECQTNDGKTKVICVKGQTVNENQAKAMCEAGDFDDLSDCKNW